MEYDKIEHNVKLCYKLNSQKHLVNKIEDSMEMKYVYTQKCYHQQQVACLWMSSHVYLAGKEQSVKNAHDNISEHASTLEWIVQLEEE